MKSSYLVYLSMMVGAGMCKPVAEAGADPDPFFFDVSLVVELHPEERLAEAHQNKVSHLAYMTQSRHMLFTINFQIKFDSEKFHTDGSPGDYVYQSVSIVLEHDFCLLTFLKWIDTVYEKSLRNIESNFDKTQTTDRWQSVVIVLSIIGTVVGWFAYYMRNMACCNTTKPPGNQGDLVRVEIAE